MFKNYILFYSLSFLVLFNSNIGKAQHFNNIIDSLKTAALIAPFDTQKVKLKLDIIEEIYGQNSEDVIPLSNDLIKFIDSVLLNTNEKQKNFLLSSKASCYNNIGAILSQKGDIKGGLIYFHKSLNILEKLKVEKSISSTLNNMGYLYSSIKDNDNALKYYTKSLEIKEKLNDKKGIAVLLNNMASIYEDINDTAKAMQCFKKSYSISEMLNDTRGMALALNNIGYSYDKSGKRKLALINYEKSLKFRLEINDKRGIAESMNNIGSVYFLENDNTKALEFASKSLTLSKELGYPEYIKRSANLLREIYLKKKDFSKAYEMYTLYIAMRDSIINVENKNEALKISYEYEYAKKTTADSVRNFESQKYEKVKYESELNKQRYYTYGGLIGFVLMLLVAVVSFKAYRSKQKSNEAITLQKKIIEGKQKEIIDSITYAKRIQQSLLPTHKYIDNNIIRLKEKKE